MTRKILASVAIAVCVAGAAWEREGTVAAQESVAAARALAAGDASLRGDCAFALPCGDCHAESNRDARKNLTCHEHYFLIAGWTYPAGST